MGMWAPGSSDSLTLTLGAAWCSFTCRRVFRNANLLLSKHLEWCADAVIGGVMWCSLMYCRHPEIERFPQTACPEVVYSACTTIYQPVELICGEKKKIGFGDVEHPLSVSPCELGHEIRHLMIHLILDLIPFVMLGSRFNFLMVFFFFLIKWKVLTKKSAFLLPYSLSI